MEANDASPASRCRACGAHQPARTGQEGPAANRYCAVCATPESDDDLLDRLQGEQQTAGRLYGNRLVSPTPEIVAFMAGWDVSGKGAADQSLVPFDLWVNRAHAVMLVRCNILTPSQGRAILDGLAEIERLYGLGQFTVKPALEDVHTSIETYLTSDLGIDAALSPAHGAQPQRPGRYGHAAVDAGAGSQPGMAEPGLHERAVDGGAPAP